MIPLTWYRREVKVVEVEVQRSSHQSIFQWRCFLFVLYMCDATTQYLTAEIICSKLNFCSNVSIKSIYKSIETNRAFPIGAYLLHFTRHCTQQEGIDKKNDELFKVLNNQSIDRNF